MAIATDGFGTILAGLEAGGDVGTAAAKDVGTALGNVVELIDVGAGVPGLPAIDGSRLTGIDAGGGDLLAANDLSDVDDVNTARTNLYAPQIYVADAAPTNANNNVDAAEIGRIFARGDLWLDRTIPQLWVCQNAAGFDAAWVPAVPEPTTGVRTFNWWGEGAVETAEIAANGGVANGSIAGWFDLGMVHRLKVVALANTQNLTIEFFAENVKTTLLYQAVGVDAFTTPYEDLVPWHYRDEDGGKALHYRITNNGASASVVVLTLQAMGE